MPSLGAWGRNLALSAIWRYASWILSCSVCLPIFFSSSTGLYCRLRSAHTSTCYPLPSHLQTRGRMSLESITTEIKEEIEKLKQGIASVGRYRRKAEEG